MIQISQYFKQQTYYLLTNNHISLSIINNILIIKSNPSNINIIKLLNKQFKTQVNRHLKNSNGMK